MTNINGKVLKTKGSAYTGIRFEQYAFATAEDNPEHANEYPASLSGFDFSSLHNPEYGAYMFYGNMWLSSFKFQPDIESLPYHTFGGFAYPNYGLTVADLSIYPKLKGIIHKCFNHCDGLKVLDLSNTDTYYLENHDIEYMKSLEIIKIGVKKDKDGKCVVRWGGRVDSKDIFQYLPNLREIYILSEGPLDEVILPNKGYPVFEQCYN